MPQPIAPDTSGTGVNCTFRRSSSRRHCISASESGGASMRFGLKVCMSPGANSARTGAVTTLAPVVATVPATLAVVVTPVAATSTAVPTGATGLMAQPAATSTAAMASMRVGRRLAVAVLLRRAAVAESVAVPSPIAVPHNPWGRAPARIAPRLATSR